MFGLVRHFAVKLFKNGTEAAEAGYIYKPEEYSPLVVKEVIVVREGTTSGNPTVDFILEDQSGKKFVFLVTGNLIKSIPC